MHRRGRGGEESFIEEGRKCREESFIHLYLEEGKEKKVIYRRGKQMYH